MGGEKPQEDDTGANLGFEAQLCAAADALAGSTVSTQESEGRRAKVTALGLLRYLRDFVELKSKIVRKVETYERDGIVLWFGALPQARDCHSPAWAAEEERNSTTWLEVKKQTLPAMPPPPTMVESWVDLKALRNAHQEPRLNEVAYVPDQNAEGMAPQTLSGAGPNELRLENHPEVRRAWEAYLPRWRTWAADYRQKAAIQRTYADLFRVHQQLKRAEELYELGIGMGLLGWRVGNQDVQRHVLMIKAELQFDAERGIVTVRCPESGAQIRLEDDMLEPKDRPPRERYEVAKAQIDDLDDAIWDHVRVLAILRGWGHALHDEAEVFDCLAARSQPSAHPVIELAPALILRRRTTRGTAQLYRQLIDQLESGEELSFGLRRLVEPVDDEVDGDPAGNVETPPTPGSTAESKETYFPLPANHEQRMIIDRLRSRRGVLVQGPPGTGKSHTIANLISHLLATGQRVLVTSETSRALRVLKGKVPIEVRPLCVSLLDDDTGSFAELEQSVQGIVQRHSTWTESLHDARIEELERALDVTRRGIARTSRELLDHREELRWVFRLASAFTCAYLTHVWIDRRFHGWAVNGRDPWKRGGGG